MRINKISVLILICTFLEAIAFAGDRSVSLSGGWLHTSSSNYGDSGVAGVRVEQPVTNIISLGLEGMYHGSKDIAGYGRMSGESVLGEVIAYPLVYKGLKPYVLGGLGWSWWQFDRSEDMERRDIVIKMGDTLAYKLGGGVLIPLKDGWSVPIEWSWFKAMVPKDSHYGSNGSFADVVGDNPDGFGEEEILLTVGLRKRF